MAINDFAKERLKAVVEDEDFYAAFTADLQLLANGNFNDAPDFFPVPGTLTTPEEIFYIYSTSVKGFYGIPTPTSIFSFVDGELDDAYSNHAFRYVVQTALIGFSTNINEITVDAYVKFLEQNVGIEAANQYSRGDYSEQDLLDKIIDEMRSTYISMIRSAQQHLCKKILDRLKIWKKYSSGGISEDEIESILQDELNYISEGNIETDLNDRVLEDGNLIQLIKILSPDTLDENAYSYLTNLGFKGRMPTAEQSSAYFRSLSKINIDAINTISSSQLTKMFEKLESYGILELMSYAAEIDKLASQRLQSTYTLGRSLDEYVDETTDIPWLTKIGQVLTIIRRDPIFLGTLQYYFPSIVSFILTATAAITDYSETEISSGEDILNDPDAFIQSLERAFGVNSQGDPLFKMAIELTNTAARIKAVLDQSPYRPNVPPGTPDIFHLRLGAANFYVPPIAININTAFKTGSLSGAAIRQKNSAKFNSGHKETSIRIRLFFPNYEEIWGISIDQATKTSLNNNFQIDFGYKEDGSGNQIKGDSEQKIDRFLSSLRGLVAAFKYSPILPVKNHYLNSVHDITAVALSDMTISTIPNYPFALVVDLELLHFNHKPFLPMIKDFNQAIHWGKYRHYMGMAAGALHKYVNEEFLLKTGDEKTEDFAEEESSRPFGSADTMERYAGTNTDYWGYKEEVFTTNIVKEWVNGNNITLYTPAESQTKIFLPDTTSFRSEQEKILDDLGSNFWNSLAKRFGLDINESSYYRPLNEAYSASVSKSYAPSISRLIKESTPLLTAGINAETFSDKAFDYLVEKFIQENRTAGITTSQKNWLRSQEDTSEPYPTIIPSIKLNGEYIRQTDQTGAQLDGASLNFIKQAIRLASENYSNYLDRLAEAEASRLYNVRGGDKQEILNQVKDQMGIAFSALVYERFFSSPIIKEYMEANRQKYGQFTFKEWEVPMLKVDLNPSESIVNAVSVNMGNNLVKLQLQMQDEPTYQHVGGRDTTISVSMTVFGEKELMKIRRVFDHITGLARLEHATGVLGFLGIKNIITALAGVKYVLPLNYSINTIPNYPHVYSVELSFVDFDIFQQRREELSSKQQTDLINHFKNKRNPFLRIKQLWGAFNAYPDLPLEIRDSENEIVGHLDPDYYFRSFEMFDDDVVNNIKNQTPKLQSYLPEGDGSIDESDVIEVAGITQAIINFLREYNPGQDGSEQVLQEMVDFVNSRSISKARFISIFNGFVQTQTTEFDTIRKYNLMTDFIEFSSGEDIYEYGQLPETSISIGNVEVDGADKIANIYAALQGEYSLADDPNGVSIDPDEIDFHAIIDHFPAPAPSENGSVDAQSTDIASNKIPSVMRTALGNYYGYISRENGRFYFDDAVQRAAGGFNFAYKETVDVQTPETGTTKTLTAVQGVKALSEYQTAYDGNVASHWEKMLADTKYRDISGRMLRVFPTYMLWLIDEGGYFAGVKLFDNFYGLQSIIDFSVVSSEDLLGDTLIFRVSNLYSKLTRPEASKVFNPNIDDYNQDPLSLQEGLENIYERTINVARNILSGMRNEYVVDINSIRLKPGVRVHLRGGYGSNPNSLQTLFNGVITDVQAGEIVTVTAQSDAIELGAVVNSTKQKGHSGRIDGGIDTGLWLSEPRDLMVRLLSMGTSRFREGIAHATRGTVFSENKFGIRHFGCMLYEPLTPGESSKNQQIRDRIASTYTTLGSDASLGEMTGSVGGLMVNTSILPMMATLWSNFSAEVDLELFKRNIYPGNGTGVAQFLGGDLDDGWSTVASYSEPPSNGELTQTEAYIGRATDSAWNRLLERYNTSDANAKMSLDSLVAQNQLENSRGRANLVKNILNGTLTAGAFAINPILGASALTLSGVLSGRGGTNVFKTLGLVSGDDDDLSGFDEVSFRAQTYMRSVWDIFQTCAKMLPNYIVAVRPFEDRSTVFYGKPHWLYTSGVVPVTTGYSVAQDPDSNSPIPQARGVDESFNEIMQNINKNTNPLSDYNAYFGANETIGSLQANLITEQLNNEGVFKPTPFLEGKLINFYSENSKAKRTTENGEVITKAKLPVSKGYVTIGPHLPFKLSTETSQIQTTEVLVSEMAKEHKQISNLLPQYSFPYFVDLVDNDYLSSSPFSGLLEKASDEDNQGYRLFKSTIGSAAGADSISDNDTLTPIFESLATTIKSALDLEIANLSEEYARMPIPDINPIPNNEDEDIVAPEEWEYASDPYSEWGIPESADHEQFYVAMRWPYIPNAGSDTEQDRLFTKEKLMQKYGLTELVGDVQEYKNSRILIYNPMEGVAVVCAPAFFLWTSEDDGGEIISTEGEYGVYDYSGKIEAIVSPDAAQYLGIPFGATSENVFESVNDNGSISYRYTGPVGVGSIKEQGFAECFFAFVPDNVPLGVVSKSKAPAQFFSTFGSSFFTSEQVLEFESTQFIIGFGTFSPDPATNSYLAVPYNSSPYGAMPNLAGNQNALAEYKSTNASASYSLQTRFYGGNVLSNKTPDSTDGVNYFKAIINASTNTASLNTLSRDSLYKILDAELDTTGSSTTGSGRKAFVAVFDPLDQVSIEARKYYDENFDANISVIAGDGRTLTQASDIWDQFRFSYHTEDAVKQIFYNTYNLNPDSEEVFPEIFQKAINGTLRQVISPIGEEGVQDEFRILLGEDFFAQGEASSDPRSPSDEQTRLQAIEFARRNFLDGASDGDGIIAYYNKLITSAFSRVSEILVGDTSSSEIISFSLSTTDNVLEPNSENLRKLLAENIKSPKQLFLFMVGIFRQKMWSDPYNRAWLVLKPNRKLTGAGSEGQWDFRPVDKIFQAFIDPYDTYAKDPNKFKKLLIATASEGRSATNIFGIIGENVGNFYQATVGNMFKGIADALGGLMAMFKMSMLQMGFAIGEVGKFGRQANILNKALNDSIYYSLGRPGTLLRAIDNPFTREYGEPVLEIREPFQRIHYINSFSHIVSNRIQENLNNVATVITAVSDGKYPVTVALDKGAPAERQVEKTIETGIYYDNLVGSGFLGFLHPFMHPIQTMRSFVKNVQGAPDELIARRIGLGHLKESIKDIYTGELIILGNGDIRPHDLVYLADVYERMYGIFEVEQVVHHFTPELGYITSITPNALVTVNDPSRWFMTTWIHSWLSTQNIRNDTRIMLQAIQSGNTGLVIGNGISIDAINEALLPQMLGAFQFTHGSSALAKDMMAYETAVALPGKTEGIAKLAQANSASGGLATSVFGLTMSLAVGGATAAAAIATGGAALAGAGLSASLLTGTGAALGGIGLVGSLSWSGWKWVRDNLLDQHGCYVQYLNKNGQPMDAGLSYNQGMVVGKYHSKALLPGILGVRANVRTQDGYSHIRTDDLMKSMGWRETEIKDFVRYISYENALVHAKILNLSGLGPEKAGLGMYFKVIARAIDFTDGDTIRVEDVITGQTFTIRFDGIDTGEINTTSAPINLNGNTSESSFSTDTVKITSIETYSESEKEITTESPHGLLSGYSVLISNVATNNKPSEPTYSGAFDVLRVLDRYKFTIANTETEDAILNNLSSVTSNEILSYTNTTVPSGRAATYTREVLSNRLFVLRINPTRDGNTAVLEEQYEAGDLENKVNNYLVDSKDWQRVIATIFYYSPENAIEIAKATVTSAYYSSLKDSSIDIDDVKNKIKDSFYDKSAFYVKFSQIYRAAKEFSANYWTQPANPSLVDSFISSNVSDYNALVQMKILESIYSKASDWPIVMWDEYYEDGYPVTFNWELVVNNYATVYIKDIQRESKSVTTAEEMGAPLIRVT